MDIKKLYVDYFKSKDHTILPAASLVPDDRTTLFTSSGIQQLVPYIVAEDDHPVGKRLTNYQKCLRLTDFDNIGDSYHHTFFEMLGNWSINDYFKNEVIEMSYEFLTKVIGFDPNKLAVTVFGGADDIPRDDEASAKWQSLGIPEDRIAYLGYKENWWPALDEKGPCGTDTEIFYWRSDEPAPKKFDPEDDRWVEIWNNVFIQFNRLDDLSLSKLSKKYIDTGMGVERMTSIIENKTDNYESSLFTPIISTVEKYSNKSYSDEENKKNMRIIADHIRAIVMVVAEDKTIFPSNKDRGSILKRLIRKTAFAAYNLGIANYEEFSKELVDETIKTLEVSYPHVKEAKSRINTFIDTESKKFFKTLEKGQKIIGKTIETLREENLTHVDSKVAFRLYETYGIPFDISFPIFDAEGITYNPEEIDQLFEEHRKISKANVKEKFGEGISDNKQKVKRPDEVQ